MSRRDRAERPITLREPSREPRPLELPRGLERALAAGHPWVYREHVPAGFRAPAGTWVPVVAGQHRGVGLWDPSSPIALRMIAGATLPSPGWVARQIEQAWALREPLRHAGVTAYRCLFGEGDGVPGLSMDLYGDFAVVLTYADAVSALVPEAADAVQQLGRLRGVVRRRRGASGQERLELLVGEAPPPRLVVEEYGVRLLAELHAGQKSGLFLDHRENRRWLAPWCEGRRVLNLFSYTGAFSVHAARAGAAHVTNVDLAAPALDAARANFIENGLEPASHAFVTGDCLEFLSRAVEQGQRWDVVICDPPSFARSREQLRPALKAYERLMLAALRVTEPGGLLAAASCTAQVSPQLFREVLVESARRAHRRLQLVHDAGQPLDHPVMLQHPEGRYLKFMVSRVLSAR